jgi:hypothetical protein
MVHKLDKTRNTLADQQLKLKAMRTNKVNDQLSIETKVFKVLKDIGIELSSYHGGSLNGKDIKKVMNNASHVFDCISVVFKEGKRDDCLLSDAEIELLCKHFCEVFVLCGNVLTWNLCKIIPITQPQTCVLDKCRSNKQIDDMGRLSY